MERLEELDALEAMYGGDGEFQRVGDDQVVITVAPHTTLVLTVPTSYPGGDAPPSVRLRGAARRSRRAHDAIAAHARSLVDTAWRERPHEPLLIEVVAEVAAFAAECDAREEEVEQDDGDHDEAPAAQPMSRSYHWCEWLVSRMHQTRPHRLHHVYDPVKRRKVTALASQLGVVGFLMTGKPGAAVAEGPCDAVDAFGRGLRALPWKRCQLRHEETDDGSGQWAAGGWKVAVGGGGGDAGRWCDTAAQGFSELDVDFHGRRGNHAVMAQVRDHMDAHGVGHAFEALFGV